MHYNLRNALQLPWKHGYTFYMVMYITEHTAVAKVSNPYGEHLVAKFVEVKDVGQR